MKRRPLLSLLGILALLLIAGGVAAFVLKRQAAVIPVRTAAVTRVERLASLVCMSGELRAPSRAKLVRTPAAAPLEAVMLVDETDLLKLKAGQAARVHVDALPTSQPLGGKIAEIGASPARRGPNGQAYRVVLELAALPAQLKLGMSCSAEVAIAERLGPLVMPIGAMIPRRGGAKDVYGAFIKGEDGTAHFREVKTGLMGEMNVEVLAGLKAGEEVITGPLVALRGLDEGTAVRLETAADQAAAERRRQAEEKKAAAAKKKAEAKK